jgi:hypothetical protein
MSSHRPAAYHALTSKGQESERLSSEATAHVCQQFLDWEPFYLPSTKRAVIDGFCVDKKSREVVGMFEAKTRFETVERFKTDFHNVWMLSHDKVFRSRVMTDWLHIPLWGIVYLAPSKTCVVGRLWNDKNHTEVRYTVATATMTSNINKTTNKVADCCFFRIENLDFYDLTGHVSDIQTRPAHA